MLLRGTLIVTGRDTSGPYVPDCILKRQGCTRKTCCLAVRASDTTDVAPLLSLDVSACGQGISCDRSMYSIEDGCSKVCAVLPEPILNGESRCIRILPPIVSKTESYLYASMLSRCTLMITVMFEPRSRSGNDAEFV